MCTSIKHGYCVGRNLDVFKSYGEEIIITPKRYSISLRREENVPEHYAMVGMGTVARGYPLYFDAVNEHGLYAAGLNYVGNAKYLTPRDGKINLAPYELIPYILSRCKSASEAEALLHNVNLIDVPFSRELSNAQLHWMIADKENAIVAEPDDGGISIYKNTVGVLSNNPHFPYQLLSLGNYLSLSPITPENTLAPEVKLEIYSEGMGAVGLPGDLSSTSRFVRAVYHKSHARGDGGASTLFHLLSSVAMPDGSVKVGEEYERTEYSTVADLNSITYYYRAYSSSAVAAVKLFSEDLDTPSLIRYPLITEFSPIEQN